MFPYNLQQLVLVKAAKYGQNPNIPKILHLNSFNNLLKHAFVRVQLTATGICSGTI